MFRVPGSISRKSQKSRVSKFQGLSQEQNLKIPEVQSPSESQGVPEVQSSQRVGFSFRICFFYFFHRKFQKWLRNRSQIVSKS